jgi:hypothetical protein
MATVFVLTANRTADGRAVYLTADRRWSERLHEAEAHPTSEEDGAPLSWAKGEQRDVCDPYLLSVDETPAGLIANSARERIRAAGPRWIAERFGYEV